MSEHRLPVFNFDELTLLTGERWHPYSLGAERLVLSSEMSTNNKNWVVKYLYSPVHNCLKFSAVLRSYLIDSYTRSKPRSRGTAYFGTISLNNSILIRPAGVSPIWISMNTTGLVDDMFNGKRRVEMAVETRISSDPFRTRYGAPILSNLTRH